MLEKTKQKISQTFKLKKIIPQNYPNWKPSYGMLGKVAWNKGKKNIYSQETLDKISIGRKNRNIKGENHPWWKGGISKNKDYYNREWCREYRRKRGKQYVQLCNNKRRLKTKDLCINIIQLVYEDNIKKFGTLTCYLCLLPIEFGKDSLEHKIPLSQGGTNEYNNLAVSCQRCNCKKGKKTEDEYRRIIDEIKSIKR